MTLVPVQQPYSLLKMTRLKPSVAEGLEKDKKRHNSFVCECVCIPVCKVYVHACVFMHTCMCVKEVCLNLGTKEPQRSHNEERERETETESSCSQEPKLGTTERGHHNDG